MIKIMLVLALLGCQSNHKIENPSLVKKIPEKVIANEVIELHPIENHHFNLKAPQKCGNENFISKMPMELKCQLKEQGQSEIELSVCDDKNTFCKIEKHTIKVMGGIAKKGNSKMALPPSQNETSKLFIVNDPEKAVEQATKTKRPLLVDFYGRWCPPCNMLDEKVFNGKKFETLSKKFVLLKLDADAEVSWEWKAHFSVGGYPTLIIATADKKEIARIVGFQSEGQTLSAIQKGLSYKDVPLEKLTQKKSLRLDEKFRLARWYLEKKKWKELKSILKTESNQEARKLLLEAQIAEFRGKDSKIAKKAMISLIEGWPKDDEFAYWVLNLIDLDEKEGKAKIPLALQFLKESRSVLKSPSLLAENLSAEAMLEEAKGDEVAAKKSYLAAAAQYEKMTEPNEKKLSRGANLERAYCLYKGGDLKGAIQLYEALTEAYGDEFTFFYNYAWVLFETGDLNKALETAKKAQAHSYGDNFMRSAALVAKIYIKLDLKKDAKTHLDTVLAQVTLPQSSEVRSHRYYQNLKDLWAQVKE